MLYTRYGLHGISAPLFLFSISQYVIIIRGGLTNATVTIPHYSEVSPGDAILESYFVA